MLKKRRREGGKADCSVAVSVSLKGALWQKGLSCSISSLSLVLNKK